MARPVCGGAGVGPVGLEDRRVRPVAGRRWAQARRIAQRRVAVSGDGGWVAGATQYVEELLDGCRVGDDGAYADGAVAACAASDVHVKGSAQQGRPVDARGVRVELALEKALPVREGEDIGSDAHGVSGCGQLGGGHGGGDAQHGEAVTGDAFVGVGLGLGLVMLVRGGCARASRGGRARDDARAQGVARGQHAVRPQ